jgi:hypothetical protein
MVSELHQQPASTRDFPGGKGMFRQEKEWGVGIAALAIGTTVGVTTAVFMGLQARRRRMVRPPELDPEFYRLEESVVNALAADEVAGRAPIEVEAIARCISELTGMVETEAEAHRAVEITQSVEGVRTVLNRLDVSSELAHLSDARRRAAEGDPAFRETRWYGVGVGMGGRRQSRDTDPPRPNEKVHRITREFEAELQIDEPPGQPRVPGAGETGGEAVDL